MLEPRDNALRAVNREEREDSEMQRAAAIAARLASQLGWRDARQDFEYEHQLCAGVRAEAHFAR